MTYFLTGAHGFIGTNVWNALLKQNHTVIPYDRTRPLTLPPGVDVVIHLAGEIYKEEEMFDTNVILTKELLEASKNASLKAFIYVGSSSEYGFKALPMYEHDVLHPRNLYEATKGCGTLLTEGYARRYGIPAAIVRPFSVYGRYEPTWRFIPTVIRAAKADSPIIVAPGVHDFIHIDDFVGGLLAVERGVREKWAPPVDIVNIGSGVETSNLELVKLIEEISGKAINYTVTDKAMRSYDSLHWKASVRKLKQTYNYQSIHDLCSGLTQVYHESYF